VSRTLPQIERDVIGCRACPRLVEWREEVARIKRAAFRHEEYWGRPIPGFGDPDAGLLVLGLAPAAHGANRTGRVFTGDRSGDWLFAAMHRAGFASQPESLHRGDGLVLRGAWVTAAVKCAPPGNRPAPDERESCAGFVEDELRSLPGVRVVVALGAFAWDAGLRLVRAAGIPIPSPRPRFGHGAEVRLGQLTLLGSYHPSQQNTFTGVLTVPMFDAVFTRAASLLGPTGLPARAG
jgi:uracil-DNA glycosylase